MQIPTTTSAGVGDINSTARGSGARYNAGKIPIELIPLRVIAMQHLSVTRMPSSEAGALLHLAAFQEGGGSIDLVRALTAIGASWEECAAVFDYGRAKYAEWNWSTGMAWSIPLACAARHLVFGMMRGEQNDPESSLPHRGHFICNIVMLLTFLRTYPEGDDRPKTLRSQVPDAMAEHVARENDARLIAESNANAGK